MHLHYKRAKSWMDINDSKYHRWLDLKHIPVYELVKLPVRIRISNIRDRLTLLINEEIEKGTTQ